MPLALTCPVCAEPLERRELVTRKSYWRCQSHGVWVQISFFRWFKQTEHVETDLLRARTSPSPGGGRTLICPTCKIPLRVTPVAPGAKIKVDQCLRCDGVWFDVGELERLEGASAIHSELPASPAKIRPARSSESGVPHPLHYLGLPTEDDQEGVSRFPAGVTLLLFMSFLATVRGLKSSTFLMDNLFYPDDPLRNHGLNWFMSILMHANWFHFLSNMYFLFLVGDNIEEEDGPGRLIALFFVSASVGHLASVALKFPMPSLGASGGVAGLLMYYALMFPRNRFHLAYFSRLRRRVTVSLTAPFFAFGWCLLQFLGAVAQMSGAGHVNYIAHLGGAATGVVFYCLREPRVRSFG